MPIGCMQLPVCDVSLRTCKLQFPAKSLQIETYRNTEEEARQSINGLPFDTTTIGRILGVHIG